METRLSIPKIVKILPEGGPQFTNIAQFSNNYLPVKKDIIQRMLSEKNYLTLRCAKHIANELIDVWIQCNVYTKNEITVSKMINNLMKQFSSVLRYDKTKTSNPGFIKKKCELLNGINELFDIFCEDRKQRRKLETRASS